VSTTEGFGRRLHAMGISAVVAGAGLVALGGLFAGPQVQAAPHGNNNAGDVWLDNVGQPAGPGHEMDPHLACAPINLWGAGLADPSGVYAIDSWPPSGNQAPVTPDFSSRSWTYNTGSGGTQLLDTFSAQLLVNEAVAHGAVAQPQQGFHFKLDFTQDPQKHKTFWVNCQASGNSASSTSSTVTSSSSSKAASSSVSSSSSGSPTGVVSGTSTASSNSSNAPSTSSSGASGAVSGASTSTPSTGTGAAHVVTPLTGAAIPVGLGLALVAGGLATLAVRRRMGGGDS
jgi:hypothetical protein